MQGQARTRARAIREKIQSEQEAGGQGKTKEARAFLEMAGKGGLGHVGGGIVVDVVACIEVPQGSVKECD